MQRRATGCEIKRTRRGWNIARPRIEKQSINWCARTASLAAVAITSSSPGRIDVRETISITRFSFFFSPPVRPSATADCPAAAAVCHCQIFEWKRYFHYFHSVIFHRRRRRHRPLYCDVYEIRTKREKNRIYTIYTHTSYHYITLVYASAGVRVCVRFTSCRTGRRHYKKPQPVFRIRQMARGGVQDTVATNEIIAPAVHSACSSRV